MKGQIHPRRAGMPITATARNTNHATSAISCTAGFCRRDLRGQME